MPFCVLGAVFKKRGGTPLNIQLNMLYRLLPKGGKISIVVDNIESGGYTNNYGRLRVYSTSSIVLSSRLRDELCRILDTHLKVIYYILND